MIWRTKLVGEDSPVVKSAPPERVEEVKREVCKRRINPKTGKPMTPCESCPKKSPDQAHKYVLSEKNMRTYQFYRESRAMGFANLTEAMKNDDTLRRNFAIIDEIERQTERSGGLSVVASLLGGGRA